MTTAFVLSGGGSLGAVQVGMLQALGAHGIEPDLLVGTSAGAVNATWVAQHGMSISSLAALAGVWGRLRRRDVFPLTPSGVVAAVRGRSGGLCSSGRFGELVRTHVDMADLAEAPVPVHLVATDLLTGHEVLLSTGDVTTAVLASAAVPGIFPPVRLEGRWLVDGAVAGHSGVSQAVRLGATEVYVLPAGVPCALSRPPRSPVGVALHALTVLIEQRLILEVADRTFGAAVKVLPPLCPLAVSASDFGHAAELVRRGRRDSSRWLAEGGTALPRPERFLALHGHEAPVQDSTRLPLSGYASGGASD
jgi:NTE family protein